MTDAAEHGKVVLGAILGHRSRPALDYALRHLTPDHFTDTHQRNLFAMCERYLDQAGGILTREAVEDGLRGQPAGTVLLYGQHYDAAAMLRPAADAFRWSVRQLRELRAERLTGDALATAMQILRGSARPAREDLSGPHDARNYLLGEFAAIEQALSLGSAPEGDVRTEGDAALAAYAGRKHAARHGGAAVPTSVPPLDVLLGGGLQRGELALVAAWTSVGKTSWCVQLAWNAALAGRNVVFFTTETLRPQVFVKLLARHSRLGKFGLAHGLNSRDIKAGTLSPAGEQALRTVVADFATLPGRMYVAQVPKAATAEVLDSRLARIAAQWQPDLVIVDYIQLLRPPVSRRDMWQESSALVKAVKQTAATFGDGMGVPVISPWQVSREAHKTAVERHFYSLDSLAETQEAANSSDVVISLLEDREFGGGREAALNLQLLKNRDGEARFGPEGHIQLSADYATSFFAARESMDSMSAVMDVPFGDDPYDEHGAPAS